MNMLHIVCLKHKKSILLFKKERRGEFKNYASIIFDLLQSKLVKTYVPFLLSFELYMKSGKYIKLL